MRGFPGYGDTPDIASHIYFMSSFILQGILHHANPFLSCADCYAPNKGLLITGRWPNLIALLWCADRDAPALLGYEPTYSGFAHQKDKSKIVKKTVDLAIVTGEALQFQYLAQDLHLQPVELTRGGGANSG